MALGYWISFIFLKLFLAVLTTSQVVKNPSANAGDIKDSDLIPGLCWEDTLEEDTDNLLQYSCLESLMDQGTWWATVHRVAQSQIWLKQLSRHTQFPLLHFSIYLIYGLLRWLSGKESTCRSRRLKFDPWVKKILWSRKWQLTPTFLLGKFHG